MSIERGRDWGEPGPIPSGIAVVSDDAAASDIVTAARRADEPIPPIRLTGGDLARTLGVVPDRGGRPGAPGPAGVRLRVDVGAALLDGRLHWFVAHLVARRSWLRGPILVATNAAFLGRWNIAPRAHPGDGRLDVLEADLPLGDRLAARRRLPSGTHVPHPGIRVRRVDATQVDLGRPVPIHLDGRRRGTARSLSIRVEADALEVWI